MELFLEIRFSEEVFGKTPQSSDNLHHTPADANGDSRCWRFSNANNGSMPKKQKRKCSSLHFMACFHSIFECYLL